MRKIKRGVSPKALQTLHQFEMDIYTLTYKLAETGMTIPQIGKVLGLDQRAMENLLSTDDKFFMAYCDGKKEPDMMVQRSLFRKACGYEYAEETVVEHQDDEGNVLNRTVTLRKKHQSPDTTAAIFWLKNRMREAWQDTFHSAVSLRDRAELASRVNQITSGEDNGN